MQQTRKHVQVYKPNDIVLANKNKTLRGQTVDPQAK